MNIYAMKYAKCTDGDIVLFMITENVGIPFPAPYVSKHFDTDIKDVWENPQIYGTVSTDELSFCGVEELIDVYNQHDIEKLLTSRAQ